MTDGRRPPPAAATDRPATDATGATAAGRTAGPAPLWWTMLVTSLAVALALCQHWEPVMRDGWGHRAWHHDNALGLRSLYEFARECYLLENPRLGQFMTLLAYSDGPYHVIVTPLLALGVLLLLTAVALGRWPRLRRRDDVLAAALITALLAACVPQFGPMLLYRPFTWNYVFGFALNLWWLVPYRLELSAPRSPGLWRAPLIFVLGVAAGLCNEHTGVAFAAMAALATAVAWRRGGLRAWMITGLVGLIAGYAALLAAPAQHIRYAGLAGHAGVVGRIVERGAIGNLIVLATLAVALAPAVLPLALGLARRRAVVPPPAIDRASQAVLALGGLLCTLTLLASPKVGPRLYFASVALIAAGLTGWLIDRLRARPAEPVTELVTEPVTESLSDRLDRLAAADGRLCCAVLAALMLAYVEIRLVSIHAVVGPLGAIRDERIEHSPPGTAVTVPRYPVGRGRYFLGDDLLDPPVRSVVAREFHLGSVELEPAR